MNIRGGIFGFLVAFAIILGFASQGIDVGFVGGFVTGFMCTAIGLNL